MDMKRSWRSWFWNIVTMVCVAVMAGISTGVTVQEAGIAGHTVSAIGFAVLTVLLWTGTVRALLIGVSVQPKGIVSRGFTRTRKIPWQEVVEIGVGGLTSGAAGSLGATTPVVVCQRPDGSQQRIELSGLGGYGLWPVHPNPAERAVEGLNYHLSQWRANQPGHS